MNITWSYEQTSGKNNPSVFCGKPVTVPWAPRLFVQFCRRRSRGVTKLRPRSRQILFFRRLGEVKTKGSVKKQCSALILLSSRAFLSR